MIRDKEKSETGEEKPLIPLRFLQSGLLFLGLTISYALRFNLSISIVAMTDRNATDTDAEVYQWNEETKSYIFSSFFGGYLLTQIPGGYFANKFGPKLPIFIGIFVCAALSLLTPLSAKIGDWPLMAALRAVQGLFQGCLFPSTHQFIAKWAPAKERAMLAAFIYSGCYFGTIVSFTTGGFIAASPLGWQSNFYIIGLFGLIWSIFWLLCSANSPSDHKFITQYEKELIAFNNQQKSNDGGAPLKPPWGKILTGVPFYAALCAFSCNAFGFTALIVEAPTYIHNILHFNIERNGLLSASPYFFSMVASYIFNKINRLVSSREWMSHNTSRKVFNTFSQWSPVIALVIMGFLATGESRNWTVLLLILTVSLNAAYIFGGFVNAIDLSPNFAGALMGVFNFGANVVAFIAPLLVGLVVTDEKNPTQWRTIFFVAAGFYFVGGLVFMIFGKTNVQPWNSSE